MGRFTLWYDPEKVISFTLTEEIIQMKKEIKLAHQLNLNGVVFGLLLKNGETRYSSIEKAS